MSRYFILSGHRHRSHLLWHEHGEMIGRFIPAPAREVAAWLRKRKVEVSRGSPYTFLLDATQEFEFRTRWF